MSHPFHCAPAWDTSCVGQPADMSPLETSHLGAHLALCGALRGPWSQLTAHAAWLQAFVAQHVETAAVSAALLVAVVSLVH